MTLIRNPLPQILLLFQLVMLIALTILGGCTSPTFLKPLTPASLDKSLVAVQQVKAQYHGKSLLFETAVSISGDQLDIVFLNSMGQRTSTLLLKQENLQISNGWSTNRILPPNLYLQALQLSFWPLKTLIDLTKTENIKIVQRDNIRSVFFKGDLLIQIQYNSSTPWDGTVEYVNISNNNRLTINSSLLPQ